MTDRLNLHLLGQYQITLDAQELDLSYNKVRALLAYLAVEAQRAHSRDELAVLFWPDSPQTLARKNLRQALTTLRSAIRDEQASPSFLLVTRETIQLNPRGNIFSDVAEFMALIRQNLAHAHPNLAACPLCIQRLTRAVEFYKGDLLKGLTIPDSLPFEEWLLLARERLRLQVIDGLGQLLVACDQNRDDDAVIQFSRRCLALDPWNEDAYRSLMQSLSRRGQRTTALAEFERCKRVLAEGLGIEPSAETLALFERIRNEPQSDSRTYPPPGEKLLPRAARVPLPLTVLLGRDQELAGLLDLLRRDGVRLVTLLGPPGIGKTRLSMQLAHTLKDDFEGNVYFISLAAITDPALVVPTLVQALGLSEGGYGSPFDSFAKILKDRRVLLILDTFEQVLEAAPILSELLQACSKLKMLVTARAPLHLRGEQRFLLHPLALPDLACVTDPEQVLCSPAVRLFVERVQALLPEFCLTVKNAETIAAICTHLDGLPLALELAAASIRLMSPQRLLERLLGATGPLPSGRGTLLQLLKGETRDGDAHHQTLRQAFEWSYALLDAGAKTLFARLGVFANSWTVEAADAVCNIGDIQPGSVDGMAALLDNCLLQQAEGGDGEYRFSMLVTLREFALDRLAEGGEWDLLRQRHADYFLTFAKLAAAPLTGPDQAIWLERVEQEMNNLRAALDWTLTASPRQAMQLVIALFPFWHTRSYLYEGRSYLERALSKNPARSPARAQALAFAALLAQRQGDLERAESLIAESVQLCRKLEDRPGLAYALNNSAIVRIAKGENAQALALANESLALCRTLDFPLGIARAEMCLGQIALNEDRLADAWQFLQTSLLFWRQQGDLKNAILCQINLARVRMVAGAYSEAGALLEESLQFSRKIKDRHWEMAALWNLAEIHLRQGEHDLGEPLLIRCLEQARKLGDRYFEAITLGRLGLVALRRREYAGGDRLLTASLDLGRQTGSKWVVADVLAQQGYAALLQGEFQSAGEILREALRLFYEQGERSELVLTLERLALVSLRLDDFDRSARLLRSARDWRLANQEPLPLVDLPDQARAIRELQSRFDPAEWQRLWLEGEGLTLEQAVGDGLDHII
jgi:predicted ATPase/DNA-binding SARP family transcriptional activator